VEQLYPKVKEAYEDQIIRLITNKIPKGLIMLVNLFDCDDARNDKKKFVADKGDYADLDIRGGKKLKIGKDFSQRDKERLISFFYKYDKVVAWSYDDIKGYDCNVIQHTIDLVEGAKPI